MKSSLPPPDEPPAVRHARIDLEAVRRDIDAAFENRKGITPTYARELHDRLEAAQLAYARAKFEARKASKTKCPDRN